MDRRSDERNADQIIEAFEGIEDITSSQKGKYEYGIIDWRFCL